MGIPVHVLGITIDHGVDGTVRNGRAIDGHERMNNLLTTKTLDFPTYWVFLYQYFELMYSSCLLSQLASLSRY